MSEKEHVITEPKPSSNLSVDARGDISIGNDIVGRDKVITSIQNIYQRVVTATEQLQQAQSAETQLLARGVSAYIQQLRTRVNDTSSGGKPYKGLLEYRLNDAEDFCGRERDIYRLLQSMTNGRLTVLHSESGAGKTSILQAGLSPRLIASGHLPVNIRPYNNLPSLAIKQAFLPDPHQAPGLAHAPLQDFLRRVCYIVGSQTTLFIHLDQFEEFLALLEETAQFEFVRELAECIEDETLNVHWVLALRADFFSNLANFRPRIRNPFENNYRLNRLTRSEAKSVITEPAQRHGVTFESGLVERLLDDLGGNEFAPPQIQLVCLALYEGLHVDEKVITCSLYEQEGSAKGILRNHLGNVLDRHFSSPNRAIARRILESLITSESQRAIRTHRELLDELRARTIASEELDAILSQLIDSRLLRVYEAEGGELAYELAHDYLIEAISLEPNVLARKAAQELLEQEVRAFRRYKTLLTEDRLKVIEPYIDEVRLTPDAERLLRESRNAASLKELQALDVLKRLEKSITSSLIKRIRFSLQSVIDGDLSGGFGALSELGELGKLVDAGISRLREQTEQASRLLAETAQRNRELAVINTQLGSAQQRLMQSAKLAAVGQLSAGIVHDVKNPLAVIKGLSEILLEEGLDEFVREQLTLIRDNASRANIIIGDLLKFSNQSTPRMMWHDLCETVRSSIRLTEYLVRRGKVSVIAKTPEDAVMAMYDDQQIEQVLINLIQNAVQAMPQGGTLWLSLSQTGGEITLSLQDSGIGIEPQILPRIFEPFFTTKPEGEDSGLGLSVGYGIVTRHGGRIEVESKVGVGSTFTVTLPITQPESNE